MNIEKIRQIKAAPPFSMLDGLVIAISALCVCLFCIPLFTAESATALVITDNGVRREYSLEDGVIELDALTVVVESGSVRIAESNCKDGTCVKSGAITRAGQRIICLPNKIVVELIGKSDLDGESGA